MIWGGNLFKTVLLDPPWPESGGGKIKRGADRHYPLIKTKAEILRAVVQSPSWLPADDAHMYCWVTNNYLPWGMWLIDALGFTYKTNIVWVKRTEDDTGVRTGLGQYFRGGHELLLFATKGSGVEVRTDRKDLNSVIEATRGKHSKKPESAFDLIEARSKGPYMEMFARKSRAGWSCWGNEVDHDVPG